MNLSRKIFLDNWRNKVIALFFAVSIWFVAFQSENRTYITNLNLVLQPYDPEKTAITAVYAENRQLKMVSFSGLVEVTFSGPRKQIDLLRERLIRTRSMRIPVEQTRYRFDQQDFDFPRQGVSIVNFNPPWVEVQHDRLEVYVEDLEDKIDVVPLRQDYRVKKTILKPESRSLRLRVPSSLKGKTSVRLKLRLPYGLERDDYTGLADVVITADLTDRELVSRTVKVWDFDLGKWVSPLDAPKFLVRVRLTEKEDVFPNDAVKVTFQIPQLPRAVRVFLEEAPGATIPVEFVGPSRQIAELRKKFGDEPGFPLAVPLHRKFDPDKTGTYTFTEDDLRIPAPGFPDVIIRQHERRRDERGGPWSYKVEVIAAKSSGEAGAQR